MLYRNILPVLLLIVAPLVDAADKAATHDLSVPDLSVLAEQVVVAHVGSFSANPESEGGSVALWIERVLKGTLRGGEDIIWVSRHELGDANANSRWLLFLTQHGNGKWIVHHPEGGLNVLKTASDPIVSEVSKYVGSYGPSGAPEIPSEGDLSQLLRDGERGGQETRDAAFEKLLAGRDAVRERLLTLKDIDEHDASALARTLLPLMAGGPVVNKLSLVLDPPAIDIHPGEIKNITVNFANQSAANIRIVTGTSSWGDNVLAASAFELRVAGDKSAPPLLPIVPETYGKASPEGASLLPLIRVAPRFDVVSIAVEVRLERASIGGKDVLRLVFPHGAFEVPELGKYTLRVHFACPGPRPDQQRLRDENYWGGGQLVSNEVNLTITAGQ